MRYKVAREADYVTAEMSGEATEPEIRAMTAELIRASGSGARGALVEVRVSRGLDLITTKRLVSEFPSLGFPAGFRVAVLLLDDTSRSAAYFAEDVAVNRGIPLKIFTEHAAALAWLGA